MKRFITVLLAVVCIVSMTLPVAAAGTSSKRDNKYEVKDNASLNEDPLHIPTVYNITNEIYDASIYGDYLGDAAWYPEDTYAGGYIRIPLLKEGFFDEQGGVIEGWDPDHPEYGPAIWQVKANRITPQIAVSKGSQYIKNIELVKFTPTSRLPAQTAVQINFVDEFVSTKEVEYRFEIYLSLNNNRTNTSEVFAGKISNEIYDVYNRDYFYIGDGVVAYAESGTEMDMTLDLGNGVLLHRDMYKGDRYYGYATLHGNEYQDPITKAYHNSIDTVIDITSVDLKINGAYITLNKKLSEPKFYVYDLAGEFVGMSNDKLPYSTRYYLAVEEIDIDPGLSQHPVPERHERELHSAVDRFLQGGRESVGVVAE